MPSNPNREQLLARKWIIDTIRKIDEPHDYDTLVLEVLTRYPVSERWVDEFFQRFFFEKDLLKFDKATREVSRVN